MAVIVRNQLSRDAALRLFDYRDGMLYWRHHASGRRSDLRAVSYWARRSKTLPRVTVGGTVYEAKYLVWNWHYGQTERMLRHSDGDRLNIAIDNLVEIDQPENFISTPSQHARTTVVACPCCRQTVDAPSLDVLVTHFDISPFQERILGCLWHSKGRVVNKSRILDAMYADDPDGGPSAQKATAAMKEAIFRMREKLEGSGVDLEYDGVHKGYRLSINPPKPARQPEPLRMAG